MADIGGTFLTSLTLASAITNSSLVLNMMENFGTLIKQGHLEISPPKLVGDYANAVFSMSCVVISLCVLYAAFCVNKWFRSRGVLVDSVTKMYWFGVLFSMMTSLVSASINLQLLENYSQLTTIQTDPSPIVQGQNYRLTGPYGMATEAMSGVSLGLAVISLFATLFKLKNSWNHVSYFDPSVVPD